MIIDVHAYVVCNAEVYSRKSYLLGERGWSAGGAGSRGSLELPAAEVIQSDVRRCLAAMDEIGTDIQLIGPRPYQMMPAIAPSRVTHAWARYYNGVIAAQCASAGGRLFGVAALPQVKGEPITRCFEEIDRCLEDGFVAIQLNPDPGEGDGLTPGLGHPSWYPLYEKLVAHDLPIIVTSGPVADVREGYSMHYINEASVAALSILENESFFVDFPTLKVVIGYGGGSVPYQAGRWRARRGRRTELGDFDTALRRLYFDTLLYSPEALSLLFAVCGADRCMFATHHPGVGTTLDPATGRLYGDLKPVIKTLPSLTSDDRTNIFENTARSVFTRMKV